MPPVATVSTLNLHQEAKDELPGAVQLPGALFESEKPGQNPSESEALPKWADEVDETIRNAGGLPELPSESPAPPDCAPPAMTESRSTKQAKPSQRRSSFLRNSLMSIDSGEETEDDASFLLMLDVVPAIVILISAVVAGFSADISPDHAVWVVLEMIFTLFFLGEILVKGRVFGCKEYLWGADWYWSWFDILCVILAIVDLSLNLSAAAEGTSSDTGALSSLKMLKLARLGRIVRLLKFKIFQELKLMIQGGSFQRSGVPYTEPK